MEQPNENNLTEMDIPAEWRIPEGAVLDGEFTAEESDAVELDRR